ncbi:hypothetical protein WKT22_01230 [Candidatus Lokiarchaeum ossiferum]
MGKHSIKFENRFIFQKKYKNAMEDGKTKQKKKDFVVKFSMKGKLYTITLLTIAIVVGSIINTTTLASDLLTISIWICILLLVIQFIMLIINYFSKNNEILFQEVENLELSFPPKNTDDIIIFHKDLKELKINISTLGDPAVWKTPKKLTELMSKLEIKFKKFLDEFITSILFDPKLQNKDKMRELQKILKIEHTKFTEIATRYIEVENNLFNLLKEHSSNFKHIHLIEIINSINVPIEDLEFFIQIFIKRELMDIAYNSTNKTIIFEKQLDNEISNLTNLFENWKKNEYKGNKILKKI